MSFSSRGVTTMKMIRSTSTTSTRGVMLIAELGRPAGWITRRRLGLDMALLLELLDAEADPFRPRLAGDLHHPADVAVGQPVVALEEDLATRLGRELPPEAALEPGVVQI